MRDDRSSETKHGFDQVTEILFRIESLLECIAEQQVKSARVPLVITLPPGFVITPENVDMVRKAIREAMEGGS